MRFKDIFKKWELEKILPGDGKIMEIYDGWKNYLNPTEEISDIKKERLDICQKCPIRTGFICDPTKGGCGCFLPAKASSKGGCPSGKW
jgi:hypothetical protein